MLKVFKNLLITSKILKTNIKKKLGGNIKTHF